MNKLYLYLLETYCSSGQIKYCYLNTFTDNQYDTHSILQVIFILSLYILIQIKHFIFQNIKSIFKL